MKTSYYFLSLLFCFTLTFLQGQESTFPGPDSYYYSSISWKPFTLELNSSSAGHGISVEKPIHNNMSLRIGFASELNSNSFENLAYKFNVGMISSIINEGAFSLRTGIDLGLRKLQFEPSSPIFSEAIFIPLPDYYTGTFAFVDLPVMLQYRINDHLSIDLGLRTVFHIQPEAFNFISSPSRPSFQPDYGLEKRVHGYHAGLRYTFTQ